jgi:hypothetical protein
MTIIINDKMTSRLQRFIKDLEKVMPDAYDVWLRNTPKDKGGARQRTSLKGNIIHANYPYADKLDQGYSKKSTGMSEPTKDFITKRLKSLGK